MDRTGVWTRYAADDHLVADDIRCALFPQRRRAAFSASHATLVPDRACNAAQDGTLWLSKAAIRPTQMMKAGDTFLCVRRVMFSSSVPGTITTA